MLARCGCYSDLRSSSDEASHIAGLRSRTRFCSWVPAVQPLSERAHTRRNRVAAQGIEHHYVIAELLYRSIDCLCGFANLTQLLFPAILSHSRRGSENLSARVCCGSSPGHKPAIRSDLSRSKLKLPSSGRIPRAPKMQGLGLEQ